MSESAAPQRRYGILSRQIRARPRFFASILVGAICYPLLPVTMAPRESTRLLLSWNIGVYLYLLLTAVMITRATHERMRWRAAAQDEGRFVVLVGVVLATIACLSAIFAELATVKQSHGVLKFEHIALAVATVVSAWLFIHVMFALHYAHDYYSDQDLGGSGGLLFPETPTPDYWDFLYFAAVIGTSGQTADVSFTSKPMRRIGLAHCVLAYAFNTTVLALMINIASGLI